MKHRSDRQADQTTRSVEQAPTSVGIRGANEQITVAVEADDPLLLAGIDAHLRAEPALAVVSGSLHAEVVVVGADVLDDQVCERIRRRHPRGIGVVCVVSSYGTAELNAALTAGANGMVLRQDADGGLLVATIICVAAGATLVPSQLAFSMRRVVGNSQHHSAAPKAGELSEREIEVLRLSADGCETAEIARALAYSERTVKSIVHGVTSRLHLHNRTQAVAWAIRQGLI